MESPPPNFVETQWRRSWVRRLFSWKAIKVILFLLICLVTLVALICAEENWRGKRAWTRYTRDLKARQEPAFLSEVIPPPIPDQQNFAAMPLLRSIFPTGPHESPNMGRDWWPDDFERASGEQGKIRMPSEEPKVDERWELVDLVTWDYAFRNFKEGETNRDLELPPVTDTTSRSNAARAVLKWLEPYAQSLQQFQDASGRPGARYPINYEQDNPMAILLPHLSVAKRTCSLLKVRAAAELALGQSETAARDVALMMKFSESLRTEPVLISYLVRVACFQISMRAIWEGLSAGQWTDAQLVAMQKHLLQLDFVQELKTTLRGERAFANSTFDFLRSGHARFSDLEDSSDASWSLAQFNILPRGWIYFEQVNYNRLFDEHLLVTSEPGQPRVDPVRTRQEDQAMDDALPRNGFRALWHHYVLAKLLLPALSSACEKAAFAQAIAEMGAVACALERYRRTHGAYPQQLSALVPQLIDKIPDDPVVHRPYQYKINPDGSFSLYSVGWNLEDDGGRATKRLHDGDWVWRY